MILRKQRVVTTNVDDMETDDGTWDVDGQDRTPEFNAATLQQDVSQFKRNASWADEKISELDTSVSTLHLDGRSPPESPSQFHTPFDLSPPNEFPSPSLGQDPGCFSEDVPGGADAAYPAVHIDVSQPSSRRVAVKTPVDGDSEHRIPGENNADGLNTSNPTLAQTPTASTSQTPPPSSASDSSQASPRPLQTAGPSTFQKLMNKTRPHFLPPKSQKEDRKHLADWETMMKESRAAGTVICLTIITFP